MIVRRIAYADESFSAFSVAEVGYTYAGAFVGALIGFAITGIFTYYVTLWLVRKNNGVYEPEFRIWLAVPLLIL